MNKKIFTSAMAVAALAVSFTSCDKSNQQPEAVASSQTAPVELKIGFVEVDSIMSQYQFCKDYTLLLNKKGENAANTLQQKQRTLQQHAAALQKKYESNGFTTRDELERAQNQLNKEQQDLAELDQRLTNELAMENAKLNEELRDSIQAFLKVYNKAKKFDYILSRQGDNILFANKKFDITNEVVAGLNKRYKAKPEVKKATNDDKKAEITKK